MIRYRHSIQLAIVIVMLLPPQVARAISGYYNDAGGGQYWCNVWVERTTDGKSFKSLTGEDENAAMEKFRGFISERNGVLSNEYPTIKMRIHFHHAQGNDFKYNSSKHDFYVMTRDGVLHKIGKLPRYSWNVTQTDFTYGVIKMGSHDSNWFYIHYTPSSEGIKEVTAFQIEGDSYYHEDHFLTSDYDIQISVRYLRGPALIAAHMS